MQGPSLGVCNLHKPEGRRGVSEGRVNQNSDRQLPWGPSRAGLPSASERALPLLLVPVTGSGPRGYRMERKRRQGAAPRGGCETQCAARASGISAGTETPVRGTPLLTRRPGRSWATESDGGHHAEARG